MAKRWIAVTVVVMLVVFQAGAQDIGLKGVGARLGYVMPDGEIENTLGFGAQADLGKYNDNISLGAFVDYWGKSYKVPNYEWSWSVISIAAVAKYEFEASGSIVPFAGAGVGLDIGRSEGKYTGPSNSFFNFDTSVSSSDTDFAIHLLGGGKMEVSPTVDGVALVKYTIGGVDYFGIYVGFIYKLNN